MVNNIWSVSEDSDRADVNQFLLQPLVNYNFSGHPGRYLTFTPIIAANREADGDKGLVPPGLET